MAKAEKEKKSKKAPPQAEKPKWGIDWLAKELDVDARTVRLKLRNAKIKKEGKFYDFKTKDGAEEVLKKLKKPAAEKSKEKKAA